MPDVTLQPTCQIKATAKVNLPQLQTKGLGWLPDLPDIRDKVVDVKKAAKARGLTLRAVSKLPSKVDLRTLPYFPKIKDQDNLGSCTANEIASCVEFELGREGQEQFDVSRLHLYYYERLMHGWQNEDTGAFIRDGFKVLNKLGAAHESLWPYNISQFTVKPPITADQDAAKHKALTYARVKSNTATEIKKMLALGIPVSFGFTVYESFFEAGSNGGVVPIPNPDREGVAGGHAVYIAGYETLSWAVPKSKRLYAIVPNSWGGSWGDGGVCYMPMSFITNEWYCDDFWVVQDLEG